MAIVTERWDGIAVDAKASCAERDQQGGINSVSGLQNAQTSGAGAYGKIVWTRRLCGWRQVCGRHVGPTGRGRAGFPQATEATKARILRGEREISRKAIAQGMSDVLRCPVCSCAFLLVQFAHETAGAARIRHSLLPRFRGGRRQANLGQFAPRECGRVSAVRNSNQNVAMTVLARLCQTSSPSQSLNL